MNTNDPRFEIIRQSRDGNASSEELKQLEASFRRDGGQRKPSPELDVPAIPDGKEVGVEPTTEN
jgi:hypothetical protein